ncbi:CPSF A subunit region-domain-containing protein [Lentinula detonsa]|uniref:CPSF A subunit region-domain-containing protein n=1 Tax=Lentinula detonsa TaxID=2804962 RepID=A0A9W8TXN6_9AGAR|nr:CPSF A subunit region-domain-containing protein [Lentinula detonsa]
MAPSTRILTTFHSSSSVISSVKCSLSSASSSSTDVEDQYQHLVIAKLNSIQVYSIRETGLELECSVEIRGKVRAIKRVPIANTTRSNLLVLLDHPDPEILILNYTETSERASGRLNIKHQVPLDERGSRPAEFCLDAIVHPSGRFAVVSCYTGKLKVVMVESGEVVNVQIPELNLLSFTFLPLVNEEEQHMHTYAVALLHLDYQEHIQLISRTLTISSDTGPELDSTTTIDVEYSSHFFSPTLISFKNVPTPDEGGVYLIPVPPADEDTDEGKGGLDEEKDVFLGGILVVGGSRILLYELNSQEVLNPNSKSKGKGKRKQDARVTHEKTTKKREPRATVDWPWSRVSAWTAIDESYTKILIGDTFGRLALLSLERVKEFGMVIIPLGEIPSPTSITYLSNQNMFIGSHFGDSQLVRINQVPSSSSSSPTLPIPKSVLTTVSAERLNTLEDERGFLKKGRVVNTHGSFIQVVQTLVKNVAPIRDAVMVDLDGSGQRQIVTCSGGGNTGSVNVVRIGADFEELGNVMGLDDLNVIDIWPIRLSFESPMHSHLITSTILDTQVFSLTSSTQISLSPESSHDFIRNNQTLFVGNVVVKSTPSLSRSNPPNSSNSSYNISASLLVQVTPTTILLLQHDQIFDRWTALDRVQADSVGSRAKFVKANGNPSQVCVAQAGGWLSLYTVKRVEEEGREGLRLIKMIVRKLDMSEQKPLSSSLRLPNPPWFNTEISAVSCPLLDPTKLFTRIIAVSFWHTNQLKLYTFSSSSQSTSDYEFLCESSLGAIRAPVREIHMSFMTERHRLDDDESHLCVFAGLTNGEVVSFEMFLEEEEGEKIPKLKNTDVISLGETLPVSFTQFDSTTTTATDGSPQRVVLAVGSRAVVFFWEGTRLRMEPVMLKDVTSIKTFNTQGYPDSLILSTDSGLRIGRMKNLEKIHIRSTSLGYHIPRQIVYEPTQRVFGVGCLYTEPCRVGEEEKMVSSFRLIDSASLEVLAQAELQQDEQIMSLAVIDIPLSNDNHSLPRKHLFCIGTFFLNPSEIETTSGRILLFDAYQLESSPGLRSLRLVGEQDVKGCVYALVGIGGSVDGVEGGGGEGLVAAAINSSVQPSTTDTTTTTTTESPSYQLKSLMDWNHNYLVTSLSAYGDHLVVADQFSSVSLLRVGGDAGGGGRLMTVARDYSPLWPICVDAVDEKSFIGADKSLNLFSFSLSRGANNRPVLERDGFYHVGDLVTKFVRGTLTTPSITSGKPKFTPAHVFCTLSGQIGVIIDIENEDMVRVLSALELQLGQIQGENPNRNQKSMVIGGISHAKHRAPRLSGARSDADQAAYGILDGDLLERMLGYMNTEPGFAEEVHAASVSSLEGAGVGVGAGAGGNNDESNSLIQYTMEELKKDLELLQSMH